eukprot:tig00000692_g3200.t1
MDHDRDHRANRAPRDPILGRADVDAAEIEAPSTAKAAAISIAGLAGGTVAGTLGGMMGAAAGGPIGAAVGAAVAAGAGAVAAAMPVAHAGEEAERWGDDRAARAVFDAAD